jgi:hypothetical protein
MVKTNKIGKSPTSPGRSSADARAAARRDLLIYACCDGSASRIRHRTPADPPFPRRRREHPDAFRACKLLGPAPSRHYTTATRFCRPAGCLRTRLRSPMFGCQLDDRHLPFTWPGQPRVWLHLISNEQPKLRRSAGGNRRNRCEAKST